MKKLTVWQCFLWIALPTLALSGLPWGGYLYFRHWKHNTLHNPEYRIVALMQPVTERASFSTDQLAELLELAKDKPTPLYSFNCKQREEKLLQHPCVKEVKIERVPPKAIYVDCVLREPIAWAGEYENTAIDEEGHLFPVLPFFTPKKLPEVYLGLSFTEKVWDKSISENSLTLLKDLLSLLDTLSNRHLEVKKIDLTKAFSEQFAQKEIIVMTEEKEEFTQNGKKVSYLFPKYLRLSVKDYDQQLGNFLVLQEKMLEDYRKQIKITENSPSLVRLAPKVIDLRIPQLAFIQE